MFRHNKILQDCPTSFADIFYATLLECFWLLCYVYIIFAVQFSVQEYIIHISNTQGYREAPVRYCTDILDTSLQIFLKPVCR